MIRRVITFSDIRRLNKAYIELMVESVSLRTG